MKLGIVSNRHLQREILAAEEREYLREFYVLTRMAARRIGKTGPSNYKIITTSTAHRQVTVLSSVLCKCYDAGVCGVPKGYARRFLLLAVTFFSFLSESWKRMVDV